MYLKNFITFYIYIVFNIIKHFNKQYKHEICKNI
jgi:hypothetical protein